MRVAVDGVFVQDPLRRCVSELDSSGALIASHPVEVISRDPVWEGCIDWNGRFVGRQQLFRADTIVPLEPPIRRRKILDPHKMKHYSLVASLRASPLGASIEGEVLPGLRLASQEHGPLATILLKFPMDAGPDV